MNVCCVLPTSSMSMMCIMIALILSTGSVYTSTWVTKKILSDVVIDWGPNHWGITCCMLWGGVLSVGYTIVLLLCYVT